MKLQMAKKENEEISICLNCYKIKFKERFKPDNDLLSVVDVFGTDILFTIYQSFIKAIDTKNVFKTKTQDRVLYIKETLQGSIHSSIIAGTVMKGHNGPETNIDEFVKGAAKTVSKVTIDQFHTHPYFFLLYLNKQKPKELIFIAQSYRQFGFKEIFEEAFKTFTESQSNKKLTIQFNPLSVASLFEKYIENGRLNKLRFVKHQLAKNAESILFGDKYDKDNNYEMELSIKSQKGFAGVKKAIKYHDASFIEQVKIEGFEFEEAYADVIVAGRKRVLNITKPSEFSAAYDITQDISIDVKTKLPNFLDVLKQAVDILNNDLIPNI